MRTIKINPLARAIGTFGAVAALATGITFAAFTSQATLTGNTLESETAGLFIDNSDDNSCNAITNTDVGFDFNGVAPGGSSPTHSFCLQNSGDVDLNVTVFATGSAVTGTIQNDKVHFCFTRVVGPSSQCFTRTEMLNNNNPLPGGPVTTAGGDVSYQVHVEIDADHGGSGFTVAPFNLVFDGTQTP